MIFCTVGMEKFPFDRLVREVDRIAQALEEEVFIQLGVSEYVPQHCGWERYLQFGAMRRYLEESRLTLAHAGAGIFLLCTSINKIPIMMPRLREFKEHVNDHQLAFCRKLESMGKAVVAYDEKNLNDVINTYDEMLEKLNLTSQYSDEKIENYLDRIVTRLRKD